LYQVCGNHLADAIEVHTVGVKQPAVQLSDRAVVLTGRRWSSLIQLTPSE
jgi:hypothetical protein